MHWKTPTIIFLAALALVIAVMLGKELVKKSRKKKVTVEKEEDKPTV